MSRLILIASGLVALTSMAAATAPTPGPLLGAVAGPWGLVASVVGYGAFRVLKARRS
ncbi:MAG: hypothetical protein ABIN69_17540 [Aestuariivirga sp.]|jgi:hypothetical protein